jgi:ribosomal protein S18 acetylase RimI-like enzyme
MIEIRNLLSSEINLLQNFPPEDWNLDLPKFISFHFGYDYFYPIAAELENKIAGFGNGILNGNSGWIGNIIVLPEYRRQGIGFQLTLWLVDYFKTKGCSSQLLVASEMGKNIYIRIGFRTAANYNVYKAGEAAVIYPDSPGIRPAEMKDYLQIKKLDSVITGEKRSGFIERFFSTGFIYETNKFIEGFYLPDLGAGFIAAENPEAGLELLKFKLSRNNLNIVVPAENKAANRFLKDSGFQLLRVMPRMVLGENVSWKPELIFSRGAGYCG